jgi:hypothetical protein
MSLLESKIKLKKKRLKQRRFAFPQQKPFFPFSPPGVLSFPSQSIKPNESHSSQQIPIFFNPRKFTVIHWRAVMYRKIGKGELNSPTGLAWKFEGFCRRSWIQTQVPGYPWPR